MVVLHLLFLFLASVHATQWHVLWMANPDDSHAYEVPAHGPKTNSAIISMLNDDKAKVFWSRTRIIGTEGYTWYYLTDISTETYEKRYKDLPHVSLSWEAAMLCPR